MSKYKYIFFDVANTLLNKPDLLPRIQEVLRAESIELPDTFVNERHRFLSEIIRFPDKTSSAFYKDFNREFLILLGLNPDQVLADKIFAACTYLPWQPFSDTMVLSELPLPVGIISNWDKTLGDKLHTYFQRDFFKIVGSEDSGVRKPDLAIYQQALKGLDCEPSQVIFVGDSIRLDIAPARELGIEAILIDRDNLWPYFNGKRITDLRDLSKLL